MLSAERGFGRGKGVENDLITCTRVYMKKMSNRQNILDNLQT